MATIAPKATTNAIQALPVGTHTDALVDNLRLLVRPTGTRSWVWQGRMGKKQVKRTYGTFPAFPLKEARDWAERINGERQRGVQPKTVRSVFDEWCDHQAARNEGLSWADEKKRIFDRDIDPVIGKKLVTEVTRADAQEVCRQPLKRGSVGMHNKVLAVLKALLNYAMDEDYVEGNVAARIKPTKPIKERRAPSLNELAHLWIQSGLVENEQARDAMRLLLLSGARRKEALGVRSSEMKRDADGEAVWRLPRNRAKTNKTCNMKLAPLANEIVASRHNHDLLFFDKEPPKDISKAFRSPFETMIRRTCQITGEDRFVVHEIRHGLRTGLVEHDCCDEGLAERILNHAVSGISKRYDHHHYLPQKLAALTKWEAVLMGEVERIQRAG